jgi:hypothetical protein
VKACSVAGLTVSYAMLGPQSWRMFDCDQYEQPVVVEVRLA